MFKENLMIINSH